MEALYSGYTRLSGQESRNFTKHPLGPRRRSEQASCRKHDPRLARYRRNRLSTRLRKDLKLLQCTTPFPEIGNGFVYQRPKLRTMIHLRDMAELMHDHIVGKLRRDQNEFIVERKRAG